MSFKDTLNAVFPFAFDVRKKRKFAHFVLGICTFRFRDYIKTRKVYEILFYTHKLFLIMDIDFVCGIKVCM